jgi:Xaa-Pro aminopeptidase
MITQQEHAERREKLMGSFKGTETVLFLQGGNEIMRNPDVPYEFRQNSHFRYLTGIDLPGMSMMLVPDEERFILFAPIHSLDDEVWDGKQPSHGALKLMYGADEIYSTEQIDTTLSKYSPKNIQLIHSMSPSFAGATQHVDSEFANVLTDMRLVKTAAEIKEIEEALRITNRSYSAAMRATSPGKKEVEIQAAIEYMYRVNGATYSFPPVVTMMGKILHFFRSGANLDATLDDGGLLLIDSGAEVNGYSADITRTFPVNGKFSPEQLAVYNIVLEAKKQATEAMKPGVNYRDIHLLAEKIITEGLRDMGILKGNAADIRENGAHRLFFVHGLGHAMGLDDHDCGDFKYFAAGYSEQNPKSELFGLNMLRFARELVPGHVVTVEPGIYFIDALLGNAELRAKHGEFVNFDAAEKLIKPVSGVRIEDDILVTETGHRVLGRGPMIPQEPEELEAIIGKGAHTYF